MSSIQSIKWDLHENVVSTDYVDIASQGYTFKGGIKYILHYFTYANEWCDREHVIKFKKIERLEQFYNKLDRGNIEDDYSISCACLY